MSFRASALGRQALAVGAVVAIAAPGALAFSTQAPSAEQTHPHVKPRVGGRHRTFQLSFTLAQAPGGSGSAYTAYRAVISAPAHARSSCVPTQPQPVTTGSQGEVKRVPLHPPAHNWCRGRYGVTVYLQRTQICGPPIGPAPRIVCPLSAHAVEPAYPIEELKTGETHFRVR
jgi:hypothetical protein